MLHVYITLTMRDRVREETNARLLAQHCVAHMSTRIYIYMCVCLSITILFLVSKITLVLEMYVRQSIIDMHLRLIKSFDILHSYFYHIATYQGDINATRIEYKVG